MQPHTARQGQAECEMRDRDSAARSKLAQSQQIGVDQVMNGCTHFATFLLCSKLGSLPPIHLLQDYARFGMPATKIGRRTATFKAKGRTNPAPPTVWIAVASRPGCSPSFAASDVPYRVGIVGLNNPAATMVVTPRAAGPADLH